MMKLIKQIFSFLFPIFVAANLCASQSPAEKKVTVTLVRWPYT